VSLGKLVLDVSKDRTALIFRVKQSTKKPLELLNPEYGRHYAMEKKHRIQFHVYSFEQGS
jgi:hypothetical protein